jgi:two-component system, LytTR family, sensor histidine kinase AlgZ
MQSFIQKHRIFLLHFFFWATYFSFFFYQVSFKRHGEEPDYFLSFLDAIVQVGTMMLISYLNYFYFLPRFLQHKNLGKYLLEFILPFILSVAIALFLKRLIYDDSDRVGFLHSTRFVVQAVWSTLFIVIFVGMLRFAEEWFELEAKRKEIENEKLMAELRFLKAQINPHFLFNTLNNLYYLAFTNSPNTTEVISKLSGMMRYMIYDSNHPKVPLTKEIEYMENYISLEKLRLNADFPINFEVRGNPSSQQIVPFIFITFLENAFKHGVSNNIEDSWVNILLEIEEENCTYTVDNSKIPKNTNNEEKSGIGLQNVQRRLDLSYPNNYKLKVIDEYDHYSVELKLHL